VQARRIPADWSSVDLKAALAAAGGKVRTIAMGSQQPVVDVSTNFR
jgi:hypothetical protein